MASWKIALFCVAGILTVANGRSDGSYLPRQYEDMVAQETKAIEVVDRSREELEAPSVDGKVVDADASAAESDEKPKEEPEEEDEEDDDDLPLDFAGLGSLHNIFNFLRQPALKPWWQGPNVCVTRDVDEEETKTSRNETGDGFLVFGFGMSQFSSCKHSPSKYVCTTVTTKNGRTDTATVTYQCCHGSRRVHGREGCQKVETKPIVEVAKEIGCDSFEQAIEKEGLVESLSGKKTIFLPLNSAFDDFSDGVGNSNAISANEVLRDEKSEVKTREVLLNHVVSGVYEIDDFENEMILTTEENNTLRVNSFPNDVVTVNCALLNKTDQLTQDGVIHTVNKVLVPVTKSLADLLGEPRFAKFKKLLEENQLFEPLKGSKSATVFALTNDQVDLLEPKHAMCMQSILRHHILQHTICSEAVRNSGIATLDLAVNWVHIQRSPEGDVMLDREVKVTEADKMATNGVLHVIDTFLIPKSARSATEILQQTNRTRFLDLLEKANLKKDVEKSSDVTVFVPAESSLDELERLDGDELRQRLLFHIVKGKFETDDFVPSLHLSTKFDDKKIRLTARANALSVLMGQEPVVSAQCVPMTRLNGEICNGIVHEIATPMVPAELTLLELIESNPKLSLFRDALNGTKVGEELKGGKFSDVTILAPTDDSFTKMDVSDLEKLSSDKTVADAFVRSHILNEPICCSNIAVRSWPFVSTVKSLNGRAIVPNRDGRHVTFNGVSVDTCNQMATNGILHIMNDVVTKEKPSPFANEEIIFHRPHSDVILGGL